MGMIHSIALSPQASLLIIIGISRDARNSANDFDVFGFTRSADLVQVIVAVFGRHRGRLSIGSVERFE